LRKLKEQSGVSLIGVLIILVLVGGLSALTLALRGNAEKEKMITSQIVEGVNPLSRQDWIFYEEHKANIEWRVENEKKRRYEEAKKEKKYQEHLESFKKIK